MTARFVVVDDHVLLAQSLCLALQAQGFEARQLPLTSTDELVEQVGSIAPDVVLLDLQLGTPIGEGQQLVAPFVATGARVLIVSGVTERPEIARAIEAGAVGHVSKSAPFDVLLETAVRVAQGEEVTSAAERHVLLDELRRHRAEQEAALAPFARLTPRERQVLRALCDGRSVGQIAEEWVVSVPTVRTQVRAIHLKLGVGSQLEAVALATRSGWYDAEPADERRTA
ncbi:response regulator [Nocardioides caldifontis]|uniref:response regulator n=1 Tax=Nocardioides caldifontis TaxID=2588938 RepID=UPI001396CF79|nr:response regulator transcription factor [Nocardioides caldifontis]